jgi:hypothetical protein
MSVSNVKTWHIYFCPNCSPAVPPKNKLVVAVYEDGGNMWGFFINSNINPYIKKRPHLLPCEAEIKASDHSCLKYDSYVDCQNIYAFTTSDFTGERDPISLDAKKEILIAIRDCPVLPRKHKKKILAIDGHLLDNDDDS